VAPGPPWSAGLSPCFWRREPGRFAWKASKELPFYDLRSCRQYLREDGRPDAGLKLPRPEICFRPHQCPLKVFAASPAPDLANLLPAAQPSGESAAKQALKAVRVASDVGVAVGPGR